MDNKGYFDSTEFRELLQRYEQAAETGACSYFGIEELRDLEAYYIFQESPLMAEDIVELAKKLHPDSPDIVKMEIKLSLCKDEPEVALITLEQFSTPLDDETKLLYAETYMALKDYKEAREVILELLNQPRITKETACDALELMLDCGFAQEALQITDYALQENGQEKCFWEIKAECLIELQNTNAAIAIYNKLLDSDPYSTFYWEQLAHIYYMINKYGKAIECFEYELAIGEEIEYACMMQGYCYYFLHNYPKAQTIFEVLAQKYPSSAMPRFYIALCQFATGQFDAALKGFEEVAHKSEANSIEAMLARINRAIIMSKMGNTEGAAGAISLAMVMHPQQMKQLLISEGELYELRDKENLTFKEMNVIDIKEWSQEEQLYALARHLIKFGHWSIAKSVLLYAHPDAGDTADFDACIAYTMYKLGQQEQMPTYIRKALEGKSDVLFELFGLIYDADISTEAFISSIKK